MYLPQPGSAHVHHGHPTDHQRMNRLVSNRTPRLAGVGKLQSQGQMTSQTSYPTVKAWETHKGNVNEPRALESRTGMRLCGVQALFWGADCENLRGVGWSGKASRRKQEFEPKLKHLYRASSSSMSHGSLLFSGRYQKAQRCSRSTGPLV